MYVFMYILAKIFQPKNFKVEIKKVFYMKCFLVKFNNKK